MNDPDTQKNRQGVNRSIAEVEPLHHNSLGGEHLQQQHTTHKAVHHWNTVLNDILSAIRNTILNTLIGAKKKPGRSRARLFFSSGKKKFESLPNGLR